MASVSCSSFLANLKAFCLSFKIEKKVESFLFRLFLVFGSCNKGAILALKHSRVPTNSRKSFMRNEALLVTGVWEAAAVTTSCADSAP